MAKTLLCDGDWTLSGSGVWECSGAVTQALYSPPIEYTGPMAVEAFFYGFTSIIPVVAVVWGGRLLLSMIR